MATVLTDNRYYSEIAEAIREKNGGSDLYTPSQMAEAIKIIQAGEAMSIETIREICGYGTGLPSGYTLLNYIESTGTQYVDTGYLVKTNTTIVCDFQITEAPGTTVSLFRCPSYGFGLYSAGYFRSWGGSAYSFNSSISATERHIVDKRPTECVLDNTSATTTAHSAQEYTLPLFAYNNRGTIIQNISAKMYACRFYEGDTLIRQYVPCINPDGEVGLYDTVNGVFYGNAGTGAFTGA